MCQLYSNWYLSSSNTIRSSRPTTKHTIILHNLKSVWKLGGQNNFTRVIREESALMVKLYDDMHFLRIVFTIMVAHKFFEIILIFDLI